MKKSWTKEDCPLCAGFIYSVNEWGRMCKRHDVCTNWIVTLCKYCGRYCFSKEAGVCRNCDR